MQRYIVERMRSTPATRQLDYAGKRWEVHDTLIVESDLRYAEFEADCYCRDTGCPARVVDEDGKEIYAIYPHQLESPRGSLSYEYVPQGVPTVDTIPFTQMKR